MASKQRNEAWVMVYREPSEQGADQEDNAQAGAEELAGLCYCAQKSYAKEIWKYVDYNQCWFTYILRRRIWY